MRHALNFAFASVLFASVAQAGEPAANGPAPLAQDLLQIWNRDYTNDDANASRDADSDGDDLGVAGAGGVTAPDAVAPNYGYSRPGGSALTPNLERLMQRYSGAPAGRTSVGGSPATSPHASQSHIDGFSPNKSSDHYTPPKDQKPPHGGGGDCTPPTPTPEPATLLLMSAAAGAMELRRRRNRAR